MSLEHGQGLLLPTIVTALMTRKNDFVVVTVLVPLITTFSEIFSKFASSPLMVIVTAVSLADELTTDSAAAEAGNG